MIILLILLFFRIFDILKPFPANWIDKNLKNSYIIRPSIIFGPEDNFFNLFAKMSLFSPILPLILGGKTKFQPVYVEDVCSGIVEIMKKVFLLIILSPPFAKRIYIG